MLVQSLVVERVGTSLLCVMGDAETQQNPNT